MSEIGIYKLSPGLKEFLSKGKITTRLDLDSKGNIIEAPHEVFSGIDKTAYAYQKKLTEEGRRTPLELPTPNVDPSEYIRLSPRQFTYNEFPEKGFNIHMDFEQMKNSWWNQNIILMKKGLKMATLEQTLTLFGSINQAIKNRTPLFLADGNPLGEFKLGRIREKIEHQIHFNTVYEGKIGRCEHINGTVDPCADGKICLFVANGLYGFKGDETLIPYAEKILSAEYLKKPRRTNPLKIDSQGFPLKNTEPKKIDNQTQLHCQSLGSLNCRSLMIEWGEEKTIRNHDETINPCEYYKDDDYDRALIKNHKFRSVY